MAGPYRYQCQTVPGAVAVQIPEAPSRSRLSVDRLRSAHQPRARAHGRLRSQDARQADAVQHGCGATCVARHLLASRKPAMVATPTPAEPAATTRSPRAQRDMRGACGREGDGRCRYSSTARLDARPTGGGGMARRGVGGALAGRRRAVAGNARSQVLISKKVRYISYCDIFPRKW